MIEDVIRALSSLPADDGNHKATLARATGNQIRIALAVMEGREGHDKARIAACKMELRRRDRDE